MVEELESYIVVYCERVDALELEVLTLLSTLREMEGALPEAEWEVTGDTVALQHGLHPS